MEGSAVKVSGHFGEWLQGRIGPDGPLALVTVRCPVLHVEAKRLGDGPMRIIQEPECLSSAHALELLRRIGQTEGAYSLRSNMPTGGGAGASTASLVALARASGPTELSGEELAHHCLAVEGAIDPLMLDAPDTVLWASRAGAVLHAVPRPRRAVIAGGFWGVPERTLASDTAFPDVSDLVAWWCHATTLAEQAEIATLSADRTTAARGPHGDPTRELARRFGALGYLRAHTGSARGLVFAPGTVPAGVGGALSAAGFTGVVTFETGGNA